MKKTRTSSKDAKGTDAPSPLTNSRVTEPSDWRGETLARLRVLIKQADSEVVEEVKWRKPSNSMQGVPVWSHAGIICTGETYKSVVKMTFAKGASLPDPSGLFNSSLEGNTRRAIDFHEGDKFDEKALQALDSRRRRAELVAATYHEPPPLPEASKESLKGIARSLARAKSSATSGDTERPFLTSARWLCGFAQQLATWLTS